MNKNWGSPIARRAAISMILCLTSSLNDSRNTSNSVQASSPAFASGQHGSHLPSTRLPSDSIGPPQYASDAWRNTDMDGVSGEPSSLAFVRSMPASLPRHALTAERKSAIKRAMSALLLFIGWRPGLSAPIASAPCSRDQNPATNAWFKLRRSGRQHFPGGAPIDGSQAPSS